MIKRKLRCRIEPFLIRYLGLQLALRPLTKAEWQPMVDAAVAFIPAWQRGLISCEGRLVLNKSVIAVKPVHHLLVSDVEEIEKWTRAFSSGKEEVNGEQCLVPWERICKPHYFGRLGVKDLKLHGLAFRTRCKWLRRTNPNRPWQGLPLINDAATKVSSAAW